MKVLIRELAARLQRLSPLTVTATGMGCALALGIPDRYTPGPMSFVLLHLLIVVCVGWGAGKWCALAVSGASVATMATVQWVWYRNIMGPDWVIVWNHCARLLVLGVAGWLAAELSRLTRHLSELVEERTAQWKAEVEQHKDTSARLRDALERFEQVINNIAEVFWLSNVAKNEMVYVSPGYEGIWGSKCADLYRDPKAWVAAVHPADRDEVFRRAQTDQAAGRYDVQYRILRPDGTQRWIRDRAFPVRNERGEVYRIAGLAEDITERKRTRELLQTQAAILQNMAEGVVVIDEHGVIVQMNPAGERIWGFAQDEVLGQPVSMFSALPPADAKAILDEVLAALLARGSWRGTFQDRRKDGKLIVCEAVISQLELPGRRLMIAVAQDVTERLRAQEQLQIQARVLESMAEAVVMTDEEGTIVLTNPALDSLLGYARGELVGKSILHVSGHPPEESRKHFEAGLLESRTQISSPGEFIARRKDGELIEVEVRNSGVNLGGHFHLVLVAQDITNRKRAQAALRQSEETLRVFLDALPEPAFLLDREGTFLVSNEALPRSLGMPKERVLGKCVFDLLPAGIRESRKAVFDRVVRTREAVQFEDAREGRYFVHFASPILDAAGNVTRVAVHALEITERKRVESALARQEAFYHTLFELSPDGIMLEDTTGKILDANRALCQFFGYSREELLRHNVRRLVPAESLADVEGHLAALRSGQKLDHEVWNRRKNGERCLMRLTEKPVTLPDGSQGIIVVARDITKSERAEMAKAVFLSLGAKLSSVRTPVEAARAIYASADQLWKWDAAALSLYSQASDRMEPVLFCDVVDGQRCEVAPPLSASPPADRTRRIMRGAAELFFRKQGDVEAPEMIRFGDVSRPSETTMYAPMRRDGKPIGVLSIQSYTPGAYSQEDLRTLQALADYCAGALERLRAEQALKQREDLNRTILSTAMDGFFTLDFSLHPGGALVEVNDAYCRLVGYAREELLQMRIADLEAAESLEDIARHKAKILATGADRFETRHRRKDGSEVQVEISVSRLAGAGERVFGFVRDIATRKRTELAKAAFLALGTELSVARTAVEAGKAIFAAADQLWEWHCATLDLFLPEMERVQSVLNYDIVDGQRREVASIVESGQPTPRMQRIMTAGAELILRQPPWQPEPGSVPIGDISRPSKSLLAVPLRREDQAVGVLSIQSYVANAFTSEDLRTLEALADHCSGALERIHAETALRESEERYRSLVNNLNVGVYRNTAGPHGRFLQVNPALARMHGYASIEEFQNVTVADLYQDPGERERFLAALLRQGAVVNHELRLKKKDGTPIYASVNATVHRAPNGEVDWIDGVLEDITQRKQAEQTLAEALDLNRTLISASTVGIAAYKASGQCVLANEALARITGGTLPLLLQQDFRQLNSWRTDGLLAKAEAALETGQPQILEAQNQTTFGRELVINIRFSSFTSQGEPHLLIMVTDETEASRAREALRASEDRYRALAESSPDSIFILDREGRILYANSTTAALWRRKPQDLIGLTQAQLFPPEAANYHVATVAEIFKTGKPVRRDEPLAFPTGDQWIEVRLLPLYGEEGTVISVMGICRDITERKASEEALKEAQRRQIAILDNMPDPVWLKDVKGRFLACNQALARLYGQSVEAIIGKTVSDLLPNEAATLTRQDRQVMKSRKPMMVELAVKDAQGRSRWFETIKSPLVNEQGEVTGMVGASREMTLHKRLERQIIEISDREQARIGQDIHDGLCQHLVSLAFDANALEQRLTAQRHPEAPTAQRLADFLDKAISESRQVSRGLFPVRLAREGLAPALDDLANSTRDRFRIRCQFKGEESVAIEDKAVATHLYRIAQEAVTNAVKHGQAQSVRIGLCDRAGQLELKVEDDGAGFSSAAQQQSKGMGLHIMEYRARMIGGILQLKPGRRGGTVVSCCVPRPNR